MGATIIDFFLRTWVAISWLWYLLQDLAKRMSGYQGSVAQVRRALEEQLNKTTTYQEWYRYAQELDWINGTEQWKERNESELYDWRLIEARLKQLRQLSKEGDIRGLVFHIRAGLLRNLGGLGNRELHLQSLIGTKRLIEDYVTGVSQQLVGVANAEDIPLSERFDIFWDTRQSFGRSALLLSGGASLGMYHLGVIKALYERHLLPRIMSGSSAGSIVCALVGCLRPDEMGILWQEGCLRLDAFSRRSSGAFMRRVRRLFSERVLLDVTLLGEVIRDNVGDITFKEAFERTGRIINITVASVDQHETSRLLNYLTAPNVLVWSAACASCALKYLYSPVELMAKAHDGKIVPYHPSGLKWSDGSVPDDLPMKRLSELFNVNHFIVSQVNPHVVPFLPKSDAAPSLLTTLLRSELIHRLHQFSLFFPFFDLSSVVKQTYKGNITIVPQFELHDFLRIISNPTPDFLSRAILQGQRATWPHISYIRNHYQIERVLDECTQKLRRELFPSQFAHRASWASQS